MQRGTPGPLCQLVPCSLPIVWLFTQSCPTLRPRGLQHARLPCPSLSLGLCSNLSIESVMPSNHLILYHLLLLQPSVFPSIRVFFQWVGSLNQVAKVLKLQPQHQSFQWIFRVDFLWDWLVWSCCPSVDGGPQFSAPFNEYAIFTTFHVWTSKGSDRHFLKICIYLGLPCWPSS